MICYASGLCVLLFLVRKENDGLLFTQLCLPLSSLSGERIFFKSITVVKNIQRLRGLSKKG